MTVRARGLLFSSCSSTSFPTAYLSPRGSQYCARGSERFTFNFHFSCFGSRFTSRPEVFSFFLFLQLSWNHNVMYSAWGVALFTMQFDTTKPCSPLLSQGNCADGLLTIQLFLYNCPGPMPQLLSLKVFTFNDDLNVNKAHPSSPKPLYEMYIFSKKKKTIAKEPFCVWLKFV